MVRYREECGSTSSGTPMALRRGFVKSIPATVNTTLRSAVSAMELWTALLISSFRRPPKYWDMTTPAPADKPMKKPTSMLITGVDAPTAARALVSTKFPTT